MDQDVTICIVHTNNKIGLAFKSLFLTLGFKPEVYEDLTNAKNAFSEKAFNLLFLDFDYYDNLSLNFLEDLKKEELIHNVYLIGTGFNINLQILNTLQQFNLIGFLKKPVNEETIKGQIEKILDKCNFAYNEKRRHIRITPFPDDMMQCTFLLPGSGKHISAKIINMSLGGLAIELYSDIETGELDAGKPIEHLTFNAPIKQVDTEIEVVKKTGKFIACKFLQFYNNTNEILARYIMKRLQS